MASSSVRFAVFVERKEYGFFLATFHSPGGIGGWGERGGTSTEDSVMNTEMEEGINFLFSGVNEAVKFITIRKILGFLAKTRR